jgi:hypothetical protein
MEKEKVQLSSRHEEQEPASAQSLDKKPWQEPKLVFVEPKLTKHGSLEEITGQSFFSGFTPPAAKGSS